MKIGGNEFRGFFGWLAGGFGGFFFVLVCCSVFFTLLMNWPEAGTI